MHFLPIFAFSFFLVGCADNQVKISELNLYRIGLPILVLLAVYLAYRLSRSNSAPAPVQRQAFTGWLQAISDQDALFVNLKQFAADAGWKGDDELAVLRESIKEDKPKKLDDTKKLEYDAALRALYQRWKQEPLPGGGSFERVMRLVVDNGIGLFLSFF